MLSLANSYNAEDLNEFNEQVKKLTMTPADAEVEYVVEPKFDGGAIALVYENNLLVRAATRGNGVMGEEITANARVIRSVPLKAALSQAGFRKVELRGEVLIRKDIFIQINRKRETEGLALFANPRNAATGGLRMKDPKETAQRGLEAFVYQLAYAETSEGTDGLETLATHDESIGLLGRLGFKVPGEERKLCRGMGGCIAFCMHWQARRENPTRSTAWS